MARKTRQAPREYVVWQQNEKRVIRADGEYRAEIGQQVIGWFDTAFAAEQACNQVVFDALTKKKAA